MKDGGTALPAEAPWLSPALLDLALALAQSHQQVFGRPLLPADRHLALAPRQRAQELFAAPLVLLAHDGGRDPRLIYANRAALLLWRRPWRAMVGLPSRLTAEPSERPARAQALALAQAQRGLAGYSGIRIDSSGRRFHIRAARIWSVAAAQAACFDDWCWLP